MEVKSLIMEKGKNYIWVTKFINRTEWDTYYSQTPVYTLISKVRGGYRIGFLVPGNKVPTDCIEANTEELEIIRKWREENNIYPRPDSI
jgi:hypothetical protein